MNHKFHRQDFFCLILLIVKAIAIASALTLSSFSAQALELFAWQPSAELAAIILPVRDGEAPELAALRYLKSVRGDVALRPLLAAEPLPNLPLKGFTRLNDQDVEHRVLLLANRPSDYAVGHWRIQSFSQPFSEVGINSYIAPFAYDAGLNSTEAETFRRMIDARFFHFVAMGGSDVDPEIFGDANTHSIEVNPRRDRAEALLLQTKVSSISQGGPHQLTAICRGAQLAARVLGYGVGQDIRDEIPNALTHGAGSERPPNAEEPMHSVHILETSAGLLRRALGGTSEALVNTYHHQHILWMPGGSLELAAVSPDGVTEALESKDGRIRLFQFHPELMRVRSRGVVQREGAEIMRSLARPGFTKRLVPMCRAIFSGPA
jgi:gamma-glutamyl-gamma-aminobutyrate hydrolase PuuD